MRTILNGILRSINAEVEIPNFRIFSAGAGHVRVHKFRFLSIYQDDKEISRIFFPYQSGTILWPNLCQSIYITDIIIYFSF